MGHRVLVTGGAGYIGSVVVEQLLARGHVPIVLDDLSTGHRAAIAPGVAFVLYREQKGTTTPVARVLICRSCAAAIGEQRTTSENLRK